MDYQPEYRSLPKPDQNRVYWILVARPDGLPAHELTDRTFETREAAEEHARSL